MLNLGRISRLIRRPGASFSKWTTSAGRMLIQLAVLSSIALVVLALITLRLVGEISDSAVKGASRDTEETLVPRVARELTEADLAAPMTGERYSEFGRFLEDNIMSEHTLRVRLLSDNGMVLYSSDPEEVGTARAVDDSLAEALAGTTDGHLGTEDSPELGDTQVLEVYAPLRLPGSNEVAGVLEVYQNPQNLMSHIQAMRRYVLWGLGTGLAVYSAIVFAIVIRGLRMVREQERAHVAARTRQTVRAVAAALDLRDTETEHHAVRVAEMSLAIAERMGLPQDELVEIETGALLHDVGKIGVPDQILGKAGPLTAEEWAAMQRHSELGYQLLKNFPSLQNVAHLVHSHHEHFNGEGYPTGLRGEAIPLHARIFAVADAYDAITSERPYRRARSHGEALAEIERCAGNQFDPKVVRAFLSIADRYARAADDREVPDQQAEDGAPARAA